MPAQTQPQARQFVRVEGDMVEVVTETITKQFPLDVFQQTLVDMQPKKGPDIETPALPVGTRFFVRKGGYEFYVLEQPPRKRHMVTGGDSHPGFFKGKKNEQYAMPYVVFVIQVPEGKSHVTPGFRVFFAKHPLSSLDDPLFIAPLPNLDNRGTICVGNTPSAEAPTTALAVEQIIANFWGSVFLYGGQAVYPGVWPEGKRPGLFDNWGSHGTGEDFKKWVETSKKGDESLGLELPWEKSKHTVRDAILNPAKGIGE